MLDGLELACASSEADYNDETAPGVGGVSNDPCSPERLSTISASGEKDIAEMEQFLRCSANLIESNAERMVLRGLPQEIVNTIRAEFGGATLPVLEGDRGVLISETAADIISLRTYRIHLARTLREFASQISLLQNELERQSIQRSQLRLRLVSQISSQISACISASSPAVGLSGGNPGAAIATCANAAVQIGVAILEMENSLSLVGLDTSDAFIHFSDSFQTHADTLGDIEVSLVSAGNRLTARSSQLANLRNDARRSLGEAMLFSSDGSGRQLRVNTLLRRRFATTQARYERAHSHALRMAYLAKIGLDPNQAPRKRGRAIT